MHTGKEDGNLQKKRLRSVMPITAAFIQLRSTTRLVSLILLSIPVGMVLLPFDLGALGSPLRVSGGENIQTQA